MIHFSSRNIEQRKMMGIEKKRAGRGTCEWGALSGKVTLDVNSGGAPKHGSTQL